MPKRFIYIVLLCFGFALKMGAENEEIIFSNINLKDGLSQISVLDIFQDSKGYLWFATRNGLNKYDGKRFAVYKHLNNDSLSLANNHVLCMREDADHNLWIGTADGLSRLNLKTNQIKNYYTKTKSNLANNRIISLLIDSRKRLLIGTNDGISIYQPETDGFKNLDLNGALKNVSVTSLLEISDGKILIGTTTKGLFVCNPALDAFTNYHTQTAEIQLTNNNISDIFQDSNGQIWVATSYRGLNKLDLKTKTNQPFTKENSGLGNDNIRKIVKLDNCLIIGTFEGLYQLNLANDKITPYGTLNVKEGMLSHYSIHSLLVDRAGTLWAGTYAGGVNFHDKYNDQFYFHNSATNLGGFYGIFGAGAVGSDANVWIATEGGGLLQYNYQSGSYSHYLIDKSHQGAYDQNIIKSVKYENGTVWCGTNKGEIYKFNPVNKTFTLYHRFSRQTSVYFIHRDVNGDLWVGTSAPDAGLFKISPEKSIESEFPLSDGSAFRLASLRCVLELRNNVFLFGTRSTGLVKYDAENRTLVNYRQDLDGKNRIPDNYITSIIRNRFGDIWVSTFGGGMFQWNEQKGVVQTLNKNNGLIDNDLCMLVEDGKGNLWISSNNAISKYDFETKAVTNYDQFSGSMVWEFTPHSGTRLPNNEICFSGNNGFITFNPDKLAKNTYIAPIVLTDFTVNNKLIVPGDNTKILPYTVDDAGKVRLKYNQNNFSISYTTLNYIFSDHNQYAYRLLGHEKEWNIVGNRNEAYFTNISPGTYTFQVIASNNDGVWNNTPKELEIVILPPVWATWYAFVFYVLLFLLVAGLILYYMNTKYKLEKNLEMKQKEQQNLEEFHQSKVRLFTNFSHELRTPLMLIINPLEEVLRDVNFAQKAKDRLRLIYNNSHKLLLLVNQLMDLQKNQAEELKLSVQQQNLSAFLEEIYLAFKPIAESKNIAFSHKVPDNPDDVWFDPSALEKILFNLISNALKFTSPRESVTFSARQLTRAQLESEFQNLVSATDYPADKSQSYSLIEVSDTGIGISDAEKANIFTPFYQVSAKKKTHSTDGTGIGLSLTLSLVKLHHGMIDVQDNTPKGTVFRILFPTEKTAYSEHEMKATESGEMDFDSHIEVSQKTEMTHDFQSKTLLIVEDNAEIAQYLSDYLSPRYGRILIAGDGEEGLKVAKTEMPDLIVSDVMMPKMNGLEFCERIKADMETGHIPVILATARTMVMHVKEGYLSGADDYILKPFSVEMLVVRINNLLLQRDKLKSLYGKKFSPEAIGVSVNSADDRFMQRLFELIEKNISDPQLNVELLYTELGFSRSNFYRKLNALTDMDVTELIREKRFEIALHMLREKKHNISEIATYTGFNSPAYFTRTFKSVYGFTPSEYMKRNTAP